MKSTTKREITPSPIEEIYTLTNVENLPFA
jgi:hypothetical protein